MSLFDNLLGAGLSYSFLDDTIDKARGLPNQLQTAATDLAGQVGTAATFKPFTVTGPTGSASFTETGLDLGGPTSQQTGLMNQAQSAIGGLGGTVTGLGDLQQQAFTGAQGALGATSGLGATTTGQELLNQGQGFLGAQGPQDLANLQSMFASQVGQSQAGSLGGLTDQLQQAASAGLSAPTAGATDIYNQIRAMQTPEEERQRLSLENRLAAQGRLGVNTAAYGGTPEQLAMAKAQEEAKNAASLQAIGMADQLASSQQQRASQLAQLGMSAEQIDSQLASEGLGRDVTSASTAAQLAQTGSGIQAQQQALGQNLLGLGLQSQELGGQLNMQDLNRAQTLAQIGQQSAMLPASLQGQELSNITSMLQAAGIPQQQQLAQANLGLNLGGMLQTPAQLEAQALADLGRQSIAGIPASLNAEALLRQAQLKSMTDALMGSQSSSASLLGSTVGSGIRSLGDSFDFDPDGLLELLGI